MLFTIRTVETGRESGDRGGRRVEGRASRAQQQFS
jgi:hypothetical protein